MGKPMKVRPADSPNFWLILPTTTQKLVYEINDLEDCIMHTYTYYVTSNLRSNNDQAILDEIKKRYVKDIKVDESSFTAATKKELVKKLKDRLKDLTRLNKIVHDMCNDDDDWDYEQYT